MPGRAGRRGRRPDRRHRRPVAGARDAMTDSRSAKPMRCSTRPAGIPSPGTRAVGSASTSLSAISTASSTTSTTCAPECQAVALHCGIPAASRPTTVCSTTGAGPNHRRVHGFRDFRLPNSLRHEVLEPMQRYRLSYSELGLDLELEWTALMGPHVLGESSSEHCHFDQPGRMRGVATLNGERLDVDCYAMRDRTWGPHRPGARRSGDYLWAIAGPDAHWHAITMAGRDRGEDNVLGGYLMREGRLGELVSGRRRVLQRRSGAPLRVVLEARDDLGRDLHAEGKVRTALRWLGWPGRLTFWTLTEWRWDGVQGWGRIWGHARRAGRVLRPRAGARVVGLEQFQALVRVRVSARG